MKNSYLIIMVLVVFVSCSGDKNQIPARVVNIPNTASGDSNKYGLPVIGFTTLEHDFGKVIQGELVTYAFKFKNTGKSDLVIANISTSCGCTASKYPKTPVKPGEENFVEVSFDSAGKEGFQNKTLEVAANTQPSNTVLTIKAMVFLPEKQ
jgi:hypothetical protein